MFDSKYGQIMISLIIATFSAIFSIYFYKTVTTSIDNSELNNIQINKTIKHKVITKDFNMDLSLFKKDKFKKLRKSIIKPLKFDKGNKNPFKSKKQIKKELEKEKEKKSQEKDNGETQAE